MLSKLSKIYLCENCGKTFKSETEKIDHEESCKGRLVEFKCGFCGEVTTYYKSKKYNPNEEIKKNCCHTLKLDKIPEYGSKLQQKNVKIPCCDDCLERLVGIASQDVQDLIYAEENIYGE